MTVVFLVRCVS